LALRAVHVLSWPLGATAPGYDGKEAMRHPSFEEVDAIYRASITAVFDELDHPRPDWLIQFARGDAGAVLVRQSQDASLLVIGTPEDVGPGRLVAGSVGHYCLSHATCPLVAVPAARQPAPDTSAQAVPTHRELSQR
jgi:nucleotide-binding universal stress UspA family protein